MMSLVSDILTEVGYRTQSDGTTAISSTSDPTQAECISWLNEAIRHVSRRCAAKRSDLGKARGTISLLDGTDSYSDIASDLICPAILYDSDGKPFYGWLEKTYERCPLTLYTESELINHGPDASQEAEPDGYYVDGSNNLVFIPTPDDSYTAVIPYYQQQTALTATGDTVPFLGLFDDLFVESIVLRAQNRDEYDIGFELKWYSYLSTQANELIEQRKGLVKGIK
jgi:hypothetical protein